MHREFIAAARDAPGSDEIVDEHVFLLSQIVDEMASLIEHGDNAAAKIGAACTFVDGR